ncbi:MAG: 6-bladed beta-propeller [Proteobacteria bacterium]|nr:6-bladed beta-propeller [Pseudomonadota bacterium]
MHKLWLLPVIWLLSSCAVESPVVTGKLETGQEISWPAAPLAARIRFLHSFAGPLDVGYQLPISNRFQEFFGGSVNHKMIRPYAIAVNKALTVVADPGAGMIHIFNTREKSYQSLSAAGKTHFISPVGIAIGDDRFYIADSVLNEVYVFDKNRKLITTLRGFERPTALAYDHLNQNLYVTDTRSHKVLVYNQQGQQVLSIGERGSNDGQFNFPSHITVTGNRLYVNDTMNFRVQVFDLSGNFIHSFGEHGDGPGYIAHPKGIATNSGGHVFIAEAVANQVQIFNLDGEFLLGFGSTGEQAGEFQMPAGLAIFDDKIYVVDSGNRRIQVFEYLGEK